MLLIIVVGGIVLGFLPFKRVMMSNNLRDDIDAIRAEGYPTSFDELKAWKGSVPDEENAAPIYLEAFGAYNSAYVTVPSDVMDLLPLTTIPRLASNAVIDEPTWAAIDTFLELNESVLGLIHKASALPHCRFPTDYSDGGVVGLPELTRFDHLIKLVCLEALSAVHDGNMVKAETAFLTAFEVTRSVQDERNTWSYVERGAALRNILESLSWALGRCSFSDEALVRISDALVVQGDRKFVREALIGDRAQLLGMLDVTEERMRAEDISAQVLEAIFGLNTQYFSFLLDAHARVLDAEKLPRHEGLLAAREVQDDLDEQFLYGLSSAYWNATLQLFAYLESEVEIGLVIIAIERFRLVHGRKPNELEELVPEFLDAVQVDPFDGEALRYSAEGSGYSVYSVSINRVDDHGYVKKDIAFHVSKGISK